MPVEEHQNDLNDDVFGSAPSSPNLLSQPGDRHGRSAGDHSDVPRLRSLHITNGYREGIALSKESHIQAGFDEGFSLGGEVGQKVGYLLGVMEGIVRGGCQEGKELYEEAQEELKIEKLLGEEWFGEDGVWLYEVQDGEDVSFEEVAKAHPALRKWEAKVRQLAHSAGMRLEGLATDVEEKGEASSSAILSTAA